MLWAALPAVGDGSIEFFLNRYVIGVLAYNIGDTDNICDSDILSLRFYRAMLRIAQ